MLLIRALLLLMVVSAATLPMMAQTADLRLATQLNCATGEYQATLQIRASDATSFSIGTSSIFLSYAPASLTFVSYQSLTFNENTLCNGQALWDTHSFDGSSPGLFNLTMALNSSSTSCPLITNADWVSIGTITFSVRDPDGNPTLAFDPGFSSFNAVPANNGVLQIRAGQYVGVNQAGVLRCAPVCALVATASPGTCNTATNQYSVTGTVSGTTLTGSQNLTVSVGSVSTVVTMAGNAPVPYTLSGLTSDGAAKTVTVLSSASACGSTSATFTAPSSCTVGVLTYALAKTVDLNRVSKGGIVTYTLSLTNTGNAAGTNLVISDQLSATAVSFIGSATASAGTFTPGGNGGNWTIASLAVGQVATLIRRVQLNQEGITYSTTTGPAGQTVTVCTTVPFRVCSPGPFQLSLTVAPGKLSYQWSKDGQLIAGATSNTLSVSALGEYTVATTGPGSCTDGSCCPFVVEAYGPAPSLTAVGVGATCTGQTPLSNATILLVNTLNAVSYNITPGSSFTAATPIFASNQLLTAVPGGVLASGLPSPSTAPGQGYTIWAYTVNGCSTDTQVTVPPALCGCPQPACLEITGTRQR